MAEVVVEVDQAVIAEIAGDSRYADPVGRAALLGCHYQACEAGVDIDGSVLSVECDRDCEVIDAGIDGVAISIDTALRTQRQFKKNEEARAKVKPTSE